MRVRRIPPLLVAVAVAALMLPLTHTVPGNFRFEGQTLVSGILFAIGAAICGSGVAAFRRARTTVNPLAPENSSQLVVTGIYRVTRNPMYLGFALWLLAWALWLGNIAALSMVAVFVICMNRFQIPFEERALHAQFGQAYADYVRKVRRWV